MEMFWKMNERKEMCDSQEWSQVVGAMVGTVGVPKDPISCRCQDVELGPEGAASAPRDPSEDQDGGRGGGRTRARGGAGTRARA